ncbi:hypothetical protein CK203_045750 [Vitis vinifera]|uniref:Uncharacterized protein n=1 Tax=Vitis vinifera TaxID=29760 RepID=A0A438I130_VITVI|nr:hypothetical protein CK203_045750 [Vitis vinifera]
MCTREELLRVAFPSLFVIASLKEAWVVDLWTQSRGKGVWFRSFSRHLNDLKIEGLECFLSRLQDKVVIGDREDNIIWLETKMELSLLRDILGKSTYSRSTSKERMSIG